MPASPQSKSSPGLFVRVLRFVLFVGVTIFTLGALALSWFSHQGRKDWEQTKTDLLARGEKLSLSEYLPPPIPDEQNFYADPLWAELADVVEVQREGVSVPEVRLPRGQRQLDALFRELSPADRKHLKTDFPGVISSDSELGVVPLISEIQDHTKGADLTHRLESARFLLAALVGFDPILDRLDELSLRPGAVFPMDITTFATSSERIQYLMRYALLLQVRLWAQITLDQRVEAKQTACALLSLPDRMNEPLLLSYLGKVALASQALPDFSESLTPGFWTEDDLRTFEHILAVYDFSASLALVLRGERGFINQMMETAMGFPPIAWSTDRVFVGHGQAANNRCFQDWIEALDKVPAKGLNQKTLSLENINTLKKNPLRRLLLSQIAVPNLPSLARVSALLQTQVHQTRLAIALERYRLQKGVYPETLEALVPQFLPALPVDVITMQPMSYRRLAPDEFVLWSLGWDGKNQGGESEWTWGRAAR